MPASDHDTIVFFSITPLSLSPQLPPPKLPHRTWVFFSTHLCSKINNSWSSDPKNEVCENMEEAVDDILHISSRIHSPSLPSSLFPSHSCTDTPLPLTEVDREQRGAEGSGRQEGCWLNKAREGSVQSWSEDQLGNALTEACQVLLLQRPEGKPPVMERLQKNKKQRWLGGACKAADARYDRGTSTRLLSYNGLQLQSQKCGVALLEKWASPHERRSKLRESNEKRTNGQRRHVIKPGSWGGKEQDTESVGEKSGSITSILIMPSSTFMFCHCRATHHHCAGSRAATGNQEGNEALTQAERLLSTVLLFVPRNSVASMQEFEERSSSISISSRGSPTLKVYVTVLHVSEEEEEEDEREEDEREESSILYHHAEQHALSP